MALIAIFEDLYVLKEFAVLCKFKLQRSKIARHPNETMHVQRDNK